MNLLLYIQALDQNEFKYKNPTLDQIKEEFKSYNIIDLDNFSEPDFLQYCSQAIKESEELIVVFEGEKDADLTKLGLIIRSLPKAKNIRICNLSEHDSWNKYTNRLSNNIHHSIDALSQEANPD